MFKRPWFTLPLQISFCAAFFTDMQIGALLFVVPTIRFTLVRIPRSSVA